MEIEYWFFHGFSAYNISSQLISPSYLISAYFAKCTPPHPSFVSVPKLDQDGLNNPSGHNQEQSQPTDASNDINVEPILSTPQKNSYENALKTMPLPESREEVQSLKIPVPLRVADFQSREGLDLALRKGCSAIFKRVPFFCQNEVTLSKTSTALGGRNIHTITVVASSAVKPYFDEIRTRGIELLGKTVFPLGHSAFSSSNRHNMYPQKVNIKI